MLSDTRNGQSMSEIYDVLMHLLALGAFRYLMFSDVEILGGLS